MGKFALPKWDTNDVGDEICNTLFKTKGKNKSGKNEKLKNGGKIVKAKWNKAKSGVSKKLKNNLGDNFENIKNTVNQKKDKIMKNITTFKSGPGPSQSLNENGMNTSQKKLIKKKAKKLKNLPNLKHLKTVIETKLSMEGEDKQKLVSENGDQTISDRSITKTEPKRKLKKKKLKNLKKDISDKIDADITKKMSKKKQRKKKAQPTDDDTFNMNSSLDSRPEEISFNQKNIKKSSKNVSLRERMLAKLKASRFRYLNEQLYSSPSKEAQNLFNTDPDSFKAYHEGFRQQVNRWPVNPVDIIIKSLKKINKSHIIADFGCGDAKIAQQVPQKVHSFDLVATNERVTACDMANVPLSKESVDVAVFCLSLMGTNLQDYLKEANRVLKIGGILKIAEVESRFDNVDEFIKGVQHFGFQNTHKDLTHNIFYFMDFKKVRNVKKTKGLPSLSLHPCLYKKR